MRQRARALFLAGLAALSIAAPVHATSCLGPALEIPFPTAQGVETRRADVPAPRFPGVWQDGVVQGFAYRMFANGDATLAPMSSQATWQVIVQCDLPQAKCTQAVDGTPPEEALRVAELLKQCFLDPGKVTAEAVRPPPPPPLPPPPPPPEPEAPVTQPSEDAAAAPEATAPTPQPPGWALAAPSEGGQPRRQAAQENIPAPLPPLVPQAAPPPAQTGAVPASNPAPSDPVPEDPVPTDPPVEVSSEQAAQETATPPAPCGLATLPEGERPVLTLQRLLLLAAANPGPLDGIPGRRTRRALVQVLGTEATNLPVGDAIAALDEKLCPPGK